MKTRKMTNVMLPTIRSPGWLSLPSSAELLLWPDPESEVFLLSIADPDLSSWRRSLHESINAIGTLSTGSLVLAH